MATSSRDFQPPKYFRLAERFRQQIEKGEIRPGDRMPSFAEMKQRYGVTQRTMEKMHELLEEQGLVKREQGRGTFVMEPQIRETQGAIAVANGFPSHHPYYVQLLQGVQDAAHRHGMEIFLPHADSHIGWEKVDGVLICNLYSEGILHRMPPGMPHLSLLHPLDNVSHVVADDYAGTRMAMEHLLELGHRRIAFLGPGANPDPLVSDSSSRQRFAAYRAALHEAGVPAPPEWLRAIHEPGDPFHDFLTLGRDKMRRWLQEDWAELGCTALLAQNDDTAIGVIGALQAAGYAVPDDVSVVGFDGSQIAEHFRPRLTTVEVPLHEIGATGTERLIRQIQVPLSEMSSAPSEATSVTLPCRLQIGDSTAGCKST